MEIKVNTVYGNVILTLCYDVSKGNFYDVHDYDMNYLGELWDYPLWNEEDVTGSLDAFQERVETAIDENEIAIPFFNKKEESKVWVATICVYKNGTALAYSDVFSTQDKALDYRQDEGEKWLKESGVKICSSYTFINGLFMEMSDKQRNNIFTVTIKETEIK